MEKTAPLPKGQQTEPIVCSVVLLMVPGVLSMGTKPCDEDKYTTSLFNSHSQDSAGSNSMSRGDWEPGLCPA